MGKLRILVFCLSCFPILLFSQEKIYYQSDFTIEEFAERRSKVFDKIGNRSLALIQSAPAVRGFEVFRQSNEFYYLCGLETPHSILLLDGRNRRTTLYLPHRDEAHLRILVQIFENRLEIGDFLNTEQRHDDGYIRAVF